MMRIPPAALVALCQWHCLLAYVHSSTAQQINTDKENSNTVNKSLEFVNIIRDDLRRNNDDYELLEGENQLSDPAPLAHPANSSHPVHPKHPANPVLPGHLTPPPSPPVPRLQPVHTAPARSVHHPRPPARPAPSLARAAPLRRYDTRPGQADWKQPAPMNPEQFRSYTRSKHYETQRLNKLKQLNKNNLNMRQKVLGKDQPQAKRQPEAQHTTTASPAATQPTTQSSPPPTTPEHKPLPSHLTRAPAPVPIRRERDSMKRSKKDYSPSPEQLDMAPARNPEITRIRIKGRLCQRNFMNAEGPTYDKLGKVQVPAYQPQLEHGRKFHQTRAPHLVLPRCCNCCKKSVLGCQ